MSWDNYQDHVRRYERDFISRAKQPRDKNWRPVRFAVRDVILAYVVTRLKPKDNVLEVDVFMSYNPDAIPGWSGTKFATVYFLSQAYKSGSSMGIRFTSKMGRKRVTVPDEIVVMAEEYDIFLEKEHVNQGVISPKVARHLYLALTEFSNEARTRVVELSLSEKVAPERICYMVHHLTYTKEEMESVLLGTEYPEHILLGKVTPEEYLLYQDVVLRTRDVVLGGMLDRTLKLKEVVGEDGKVVDLEGNDRHLEISFDPQFFAKIYESEEETPLLWLGDGSETLPAGERLVVMVRARDWADAKYRMKRDMEAFKEMHEAYSDEHTHCVLLISRNVSDGEDELLNKYHETLELLDARVMVCPESISLLDKEVMRRLRESETMRHDIGSGEFRKYNDPGNKKLDFNSSEISLVAVPTNLSIGRLSLKDLSVQTVYDEVELLRGVNKHNVRARYHLVCDRIQFLAHLATLEGYEHIVLPSGVLPTLSNVWEQTPGRTKRDRMLPTFWLPEHFDQYVLNIQSLSDGKTFEHVLRFLGDARARQQAVIAIQDKHAPQDEVSGVNVTPTENLNEAFLEQFVPDWINDYEDMDFEEVVVKLLWRAAKSSVLGQANGVNPSEIPHMVMTEALRKMVYEKPGRIDNREVEINIVYTDGSQARPFPLFCLKKRTKQEMRDIQKQTPVQIGMISNRHQSMDSKVKHYWFRNIEVSQPGMTSAEVDEVCYQITLRKLREILDKDLEKRVSFYQSGFQAPLIGFWRAVVEFLRAQQGRPAVLEITPYYYTDHKRKRPYERGWSWN